jgi:UDP-glucose 4-epimerase
MKRVLITGGRGYIGKNLQSFFKDYMINVDIVDKLDGKSAENIKENKSFKRYNGIVHLAAISGIKNCMDDMKQAVISNISASFHVFKLAHKYRIPAVFTSSQAAKQPDANFYAMTKYIAEVEALRLNRTGANIKILRLCNVYGGIDYLETKDTVVAKFAKAVNDSKPMIVNGDGSQVRDFIHVFDICMAIYKSLGHKDVVYSPIDIGTGVPVSVRALASFFKGEYTNDLDSKSVGVNWNVADTDEAKRELNFESSIDVSEYADGFNKET